MSILGIICISIASVVAVFMLFLIIGLMRVAGRQSDIEEKFLKGGDKDQSPSSK